MTAKLFAVVFDDNAGLCCPMTWNPQCAGAVEAGLPIALFDSRASARKAIRISVANAKLRREQGLPTNDDFLEPGLRYVKVVPCEFPTSAAKATP